MEQEYHRNPRTRLLPPFSAAGSLSLEKGTGESGLSIGSLAAL